MTTGENNSIMSITNLRTLQQYIPQLPVELIAAMTPSTDVPPDATLASQIAYNNVTSLLNANSVQGAIDEVENRVDVIEILIAGGLSGVISSVFGRTGTILAVSGDYTSTLVTNTSGVSGITVSDALNALDSGKATASHVHTAAGISFVASGDITTTNVQAAIQEVRDDTDIKLSSKANTAHSHAAGDVSFTPSGDITSITVQSAIQELRDDTDTKLAAKITSPGVVADGDLLVRSLGAWARLPTGSNGQVLTVTTGAPAWAAPTGGADDQTAAEVPFTPNGDIVATDVQAAIVEVRNDTDTKLSGKVDGTDPRLTDARTPTAHAASHVGADAIQSATALQNGLMTSAYAGKLDGIEALADVTDAANVAAAGAIMSGAAAGGQLGGTYPNPDVRGIRETTGPTLLTIGAVADGQFLVRSGTTLIGSTPGGSGDVVGPAGGVVEAELAAFDGTTGKLLQGTSISTASVSGHLASTSNPHSVTAAQAGAIPEPATPATGDLLYRSAGGAWARLPVGTTDQVLKVTGGAPAWGAASGGSSLTSVPYIRGFNSANGLAYQLSTDPLTSSQSYVIAVLWRLNRGNAIGASHIFGTKDPSVAGGAGVFHNYYGDAPYGTSAYAAFGASAEWLEHLAFPGLLGRWILSVVAQEDSGADAIIRVGHQGIVGRAYQTAGSGYVSGARLSLGARGVTAAGAGFNGQYSETIDIAGAGYAVGRTISEQQAADLYADSIAAGTLAQLTGGTGWDAAWTVGATEPGASWSATYGTGTLSRLGTGAVTRGLNSSPVWA